MFGEKLLNRFKFWSSFLSVLGIVVCCFNIKRRSLKWNASFTWSNMLNVLMDENLDEFLFSNDY